MSDYVYRVVDQNGTARPKIYFTRGAARGVATALTNRHKSAGYFYRVQATRTEWYDLESP